MLSIGIDFLSSIDFPNASYRLQILIPMKKIPLHLLKTSLLALFSIGALHAQEPTTPAEAEAKAKAADTKKAREAALSEKYKALVATLPAEQQAWEQVLQENLGGFYLPGHEADKLAGKSNAWDFVKDDPTLPRVLIIGDSVSRGYTLATRKYLAGKANVHRAPENCGSVTNGLKKIDLWLGDGKWDVIHFNFGIHDRQSDLPSYTQKLETIVERMQKTGAKIIWASTTPIPEDPKQNYKPASIVEHNEAAAEVMKKHQIAVDDLFTAMTPHLGEYQPPLNCHFKDEGYDFLGQQVGTAIEAQLKARKP